MASRKRQSTSKFRGIVFWRILNLTMSKKNQEGEHFGIKRDFFSLKTSIPKRERFCEKKFLQNNFTVPKTQMEDHLGLKKTFLAKIIKKGKPSGK